MNTSTKSNLHINPWRAKNEDGENIAHQTKQGDNGHRHSLNNTVKVSSLSQVLYCIWFSTYLIIVTGTMGGARVKIFSKV